MKPKVSIVVPIYNGGKYLYSCINSIINQTLKEIEIFLVDDGSTDYSLSICKEFERKDSRITVIHIENQGESYATNLGRSKCTGEYFYTMDDDDIILPDALETLYLAAEKDKCEAVKGLAIISHDKKYEPSLYWPNIWFKEQIFNWRDFRENEEKLNDFFYSQPEVWTGLYKLDWLNENNIYHSNNSFCDGNFFFKVKAKSTKFKFIPKFIYIWNIHDSLSHSPSRPFSVIDSIKDLEDYLNNENINVQEQLKNEKFRAYYWNYNRIKNEDKEEFLSLIDEDIAIAINNMNLLKTEKINEKA